MARDVPLHARQRQVLIEWWLRLRSANGFLRLADCRRSLSEVEGRYVYNHISLLEA